MDQYLIDNNCDPFKVLNQFEEFKEIIPSLSLEQTQWLIRALLVAENVILMQEKEHLEEELEEAQRLLKRGKQ